VAAYVAKFGAQTGNASASRGTECTLGEIMLFATSRPIGVPANGQLLPISQNTALFSLLGTTYGGNGVSTFALPDLRSVAPNNMTYSICDEGVYPSLR
jgi:microcystin-dependent protein